MIKPTILYFYYAVTVLYFISWLRHENVKTENFLNTILEALLHSQTWEFLLIQTSLEQRNEPNQVES